MYLSNFDSCKISIVSTFYIHKADRIQIYKNEDGSLLLVLLESGERTEARLEHLPFAVDWTTIFGSHCSLRQ
jgi:hypothetical protein